MDGWIKTRLGARTFNKTASCRGPVSYTHLAGPGPFLYHLYDDRGLDVLGGSQKLLLPLYHQFHDWILEYDLEKIDQMFAPAKE